MYADVLKTIAHLCVFRSLFPFLPSIQDPWTVTFTSSFPLTSFVSFSLFVALAGSLCSCAVCSSPFYNKDTKSMWTQLTHQHTGSTVATRFFTMATEKLDSVLNHPSAYSSIPALHAFDQRTSTWQSYRDRFHFYFKADRITLDDTKKALFLWSVGDGTYTLLESLVSPKSLTDDRKEFPDLIKLLATHFDDKKNILTLTYDFYSCYQKPGQPFHEWKAELCENLQHCGFTTSTLKYKRQDRALS